MAREARIYLSPMVVVSSERVFDGEKWLDVETGPEHRSVPADIIAREGIRGWRCNQKMLGGKGPTLAIVEAEITDLEVIESDPRVERVLSDPPYGGFKTKELALAALEKLDAALCGRLRAAIARTGSGLRPGLSNEAKPSKILAEQPKEWDRARRAHEDPTPSAGLTP